MAQRNLQRAIEALVDAGFRVNAAHEERCFEAGYPNSYPPHSLTGSIRLVITPLVNDYESENDCEFEEERIM